MKHLFVASLFFHLTAVSAQNNFAPLWEHCYGGIGRDLLYCLIQTNDGNYLAGGVSMSLAGNDKTQAPWDTTATYNDFWVVKFDTNRTKIWDKRFGGLYQDNLITMINMRDGGYLLVGDSYSNADGDKSQNRRGGFDFWVIRIDKDGNKLWDRTYGGSLDELRGKAIATSDGCILIGGSSNSGYTGERTSPNKGDYDYWIVKVDSLGNKLWDKSFGGNSGDFLRDFVETTDGGLLLLGESNSDPTGDKTDSAYNQWYDYWLIKTDANGNKIWDKRYGGAYGDFGRSLKFDTATGTIYVGGMSDSNIGYDKSEQSRGYTDFWLLVLDSNGNKLWDKTYGGNKDETLYRMHWAADGNLLFVGSSESDPSGEKTEQNLTLRNPWILLIDPLGNIIWDKTIFLDGAAIEECLQIGDHKYVFASNGGENPFGYRQTTCSDFADYWIMGFTLGLPTSVKTPSVIDYSLVLFPNPATNYINIKNDLTDWNEEGAILEVVNIIGQIMYQKQLPRYSGFHQVDVSQFASGLYTATIKRKGEVVAAGRFMRE